MKRTLFFIITLLNLPQFSYSQSLSPLSQRIKNTFQQLKAQPSSKQKQLNYLQAFPQSKQEFIAVFAQDDFSQLYKSSYDFIDAYIGLAKYYPAEVINKSINIGKDLKYDADAIGQLQHEIINLGNKHLNLFLAKLKSLPYDQKTHLIAFLADVENHKAYSEYQQLIDSLQKRGEIKIANQFIKARTLRMKIRDH